MLSWLILAVTVTRLENLESRVLVRKNRFHLAKLKPTQRIEHERLMSQAFATFTVPKEQQDMSADDLKLWQALESSPDYQVCRRLILHALKVPPRK